MSKISVVGAGAVGSMIGGLIGRGDPACDVVLFARGDHGRWMKEHGRVALKGPWGVEEAPVVVAESPDEMADSDLVLLTVKSQDTAEAIREVAPYVGEATVVSLQNGINQHVLAERLPVEQFLVGMTATNMVIPKPGTVALQRDGVTVIGSTADEEPPERVRAALKILRSSGLKIVSSRNIAGAQFNKISLNCIGYASVLSNSDFITECVLDRAWRQRVAKPVLDECCACLAAAGVRLETIPGPADARKFRRLLSLLDFPVLGQIAAHFVRRAQRERIVYSVYQDLMRGRRTEIEYVNGAIARLAREHGVSAPLNASVVEMVHELERRGPGSFFKRSEVIGWTSAAAEVDRRPRSNEPPAQDA